MDIHARLAELELTLPPVPQAVAMYIPAVVAGNMVFVSGQLPTVDGQLSVVGQVPDPVSIEAAQQAAEVCVLNALAAVHGAIDGDWGRFERVAKVDVFVASAPGFDRQHEVANGASHLLGKVFGEPGRHARAAVGVPALPLNAAVEVAFTFALKG